VRQTEFNWRSGRVVCWELDELDSTELSPDQEGARLGEDLAQVVFRNRRIVDVGWYGGPRAFLVLVVAGEVPEDWDRPLFREECRSVSVLREALVRAIDVAESDGRR
jgi:hypothetical protein